MADTERSHERNFGMIADLDIPADRNIVASLVVLMDDEGDFSVYVSKQPAMFDFRTSPLPSDEVLIELSALLAQAWQIAALTTSED